MQSSLVQKTLVHQYFNHSLVPWAAGRTSQVYRLTSIFQAVAGVFTQVIVPQNCLGPRSSKVTSAEKQWNNFSQALRMGKEAVLMHKFGWASGGKTTPFQPPSPEDGQHVFLHPCSWLEG